MIRRPRVVIVTCTAAVAIVVIIMIVVIAAIPGFLMAPAFDAADAQESGREHGSVPVLAQARIDERFGQSVPTGIVFRDLAGRERPLASHLSGVVPAVVVAADYDCRLLCGMMLDGLSRGLRETGLVPGTDYQVLVFGIDARDGEDAARQTAARIRADGWTYLIGDSAAIRDLAAAIGFGFRYDPATDQFAHVVAAVVFTPDSRVSSYLYGIDVPARTLQRSIETAAAGGLLAGLDRVLLRCYRYFPALRRYEGMIRGILVSGGIVTLFLVATMIGWSVRRQRANARARA